MRFIFNLTRREIRSSWRRLLFFFLCIALGVGSVVALRSLIQNLTRAVGTDARALLTADIEISSTNDFTPSDITAIESVIGNSPIVEARNEAITTAIMARPSDPANESVDFVELKGIEAPFPMVGDFRLSDGKSFDVALIQNNGAVVARVLLEQLKIDVGDDIRIGEGEFQVRAIFDEEPGGTTGFRLGPRVFIEKRAFDDAGITRNSSRVRRRILYRTNGDDPTELVKELREALKGTTLNVVSYREQQENLSEQFVRTENYLALTGLLILVLGGVGVWNVARAFIEQKRKTVAVLKCLGASGTKVTAVYLLQIVFLGLLGSLFGALLAQSALLFAKWRFGDSLPAKMTYSVSLSTVLQGLALGIAISVLFSVLPLLQIRQIKPRLLLRDENNAELDKLDRSKWIVGAVSLSALLGLAVWQAGSWKVGAYFLGGLTVTSLVLYGTAALLTRVLRRVRGLSSFTIRQAINSLYRPGNQTRIVLLAVGLGAFVVLTVQTMQANLLEEFDLSRNARLPSMLFVDVQKSQIDGVVDAIRQKLDEDPQSIPTVRGRIAYINGQAFDYQQREIRQQQGIIGREFALTYRSNLDENETVVAGEWWTNDAEDEPKVSVEEDMAETLKVEPGDSISFNISGRTLTARVANIRKIDLRNTRTAFVFVFAPGALEKAPQTFAASVLKHSSATDRQRLQREVVDRFPNVQVFDVADILETIQRLINNFVLAISFVGSFVMLSGILILMGSIALTKSQRIYESAIMKTLGATRKTLVGTLFAEYVLLGALAGLIGAVFATVLSWVVSKYLMNIDWTFQPGIALSGIAVTIFVVTAVGVAGSFDVLFRKPLATLRSQ